MDQKSTSLSHNNDKNHVMMISYPLPSHVHSMLNLAQLLCLYDLKVTFITTLQARDNLLRPLDLESRFGRYSGSFRLEAIPDGLPEDHLRSGVSVFDSLMATAKPLLNDMLMSFSNGGGGQDHVRVRCIVADGVATFAVDVAEELGVPVVVFHPVSGCAVWAHYNIPSLIQAGVLPFNGKDMDATITYLKGMENLLRLRDLPGSFRVDELDDPFFQFLIKFQKVFRVKHHIVNSFQELEGSILDRMRIDFSNVYAIGPLHELLAHKLGTTNATFTFDSSNMQGENENKCMDWLDRQSPKSVLYICFGTMTLVSKENIMELWHGLLNSGQRFLWVLNPKLVNEKGESGEISVEILLSSSEERCCIVEWAPQKKVLMHSNVGGFLTHCGWNSMLESIVAGVPMIGWPFFADQQMNSRFLDKVWKIGLDMKDTSDRVIIEKMVRELMEVRNDEFTKRINQFAKLAHGSIKDGGSSNYNLEQLVEDIKKM